MTQRAPDKHGSLAEHPPSWPVEDHSVRRCVVPVTSMRQARGSLSQVPVDAGGSHFWRHAPAPQNSSLSQLTPHAPQLVTVVSLAHVPSSQHASPVAQVLPQAPQWSVEVSSAQAPEQHVSPVPHLMPQAPQLF
jgi:hypothetical protein